MTDYPDWATPQAHATAIYGTRVPAAVSSLLLGSATATLINAGSSKTFGPFALDQPGWELWLSVAETGAGAAGAYCQVAVNWTDSALSRVVWTDNAYLVPGAALNPHLAFFYGRSRADSFTLQIFNSDTVNFNVSYGMAASSRNYEELDFKSIQIPVPSAGYTLPDILDPETGILAQSTFTNLAAGASAKVILPLFVGQVHLHLETSSNTTDAEAQVFPIADATSVPLYDVFTDSTGNRNDYLQLPNAECQLNVINHNAAAKTLRISVVGTPT